jgi:nitrate/nitrite-specific signal transduction histidine kinase
VEKHSHADCVDIFANWGEDNFEISISDNGIGFNPLSVNPNQHFGLEIVHERINNIHGHITLNTSENSGTVVTITVPLQPIEPI